MLAGGTCSVFNWDMVVIFVRMLQRFSLLPFNPRVRRALEAYDGLILEMRLSHDCAYILADSILNTHTGLRFYNDVRYFIHENEIRYLTDLHEAYRDWDGLYVSKPSQY